MMEPMMATLVFRFCVNKAHRKITEFVSNDSVQLSELQEMPGSQRLFEFYSDRKVILCCALAAFSSFVVDISYVDVLGLFAVVVELMD